MLQYIIPAVSAVIVAIVGTLSTIDLGRRKKLAERDETRTGIRMEENRLSMELMSASVALALATAAAIEGQKINGDMKRAREKALSAQEEYVEFLKRIASRQVAK